MVMKMPICTVCQLSIFPESHSQPSESSWEYLMSGAGVPGTVWIANIRKKQRQLK
jgi:hypothetical protein